MPRLFTMDDNNNAPSSGPNMQHAPPNSQAQMQRMQPPPPLYPFMAPNGAQMRTEGRNANSGHGNHNHNTGPPTSTSTSHTMFANQLQPHGRSQALPLNPRGLPFEFKQRAAQPQAQATQSGPSGPGRLPSGNLHHGGAPSPMGPPPSSLREREPQVRVSAPPAPMEQSQVTRNGPPGPGCLPSGNYRHGGASSTLTMGPPSSIREQQASVAPPMEHQYHSEQRYSGVPNPNQAQAPPPMEHHSEQRFGGVPNQHQSWSHYPGNQHQSQQHHQYHQRMMYQDPGRGTPYHPNPTNYHSYSHPNNNNTRRNSFPAPPPPPPLHAFHRPDGRSSNPVMQPPNRRFTFNAITAPNKLMEQHHQNQAASRSPSPMGIPAPPSFESSVSTSTNHQDQGPKQHDNMASHQKAKGSEQQEKQSPLRESRHHNVHVSLQPMKEHRFDDASTTGGKKARVSTDGSTNVDTASILLELRTSNSSSPVTTTDVHVNENHSIVKTANVSTNEKEEHVSRLPAINTTNLVPKNYPKRLALEDDDNKLNTLHCFIRSELLEIFVVDQSICSSPTSASGSGSALGRVGLRCVHCAQERKRLKVNERNEAPMAVFYPKCVSEIYRLITSWQRCHLRKCRNLPPAVREQWDELRKEDRSRGKTAYWVTSATQLGLVDCQSKGRGVRFSPDMMMEQPAM